MNIGEVSIQKRTITLVLTLVSVAVGVLAYMGLGRLEDPQFTIKQALIFTPYPGASAEEVEREVTNEIEKSVQRLGQLKRVESISHRGLSIVKVFIKDKYGRAQLPQVWNEMRHKVQAAQPHLPPGVRTALINDDFGDVYGVYVALTGDGYSYRELKDVADMLRRELLLVQDVKRIEYWGARPEAVYVEMRRERMAALGVTQEQVFAALQSHNLPVDAGHVAVGSEFIAIDPTGFYTSVEELGQTLISEPGSDHPLRLRDVAVVRRGYVDPAETTLRVSARSVTDHGVEVPDEAVDGIDLAAPGVETRLATDDTAAIGFGVSTVTGGNVVTMGNALTTRLNELMPDIPLGVEVHVINMQPESVTKAVDDFVVNLVEAIAIVIVVLLIFMGLKSGLLIGFVLLQTICASFIVMDMQGIVLQRISLGALIIALGMLVDNAIVVTEGMKTKIEAGVDKLKAAREVVAQNQWPLLGATFIAVLAFGAIGLSHDDTGEFCRSLFQVLMISLLLSWLTAVTVTPLLCAMLFHPKKGASAGGGESYDGFAFRLYRGLLTGAIRYRLVTIVVVVAMFGAAVFGFGFLPSGFFPASSRPQFTVDVWMPAGTHIDDTADAARQIQGYLAGHENTRLVATHVGGGADRFLLTYNPEMPNASYAQLVVNVFDPAQIDRAIADVEAWAGQNLPDAMVYGKRFKIGPGSGGNIQLRLAGPDAAVLRQLADEAQQVMLANPRTKYVRNDWMNPVKVSRPVIAEDRARHNGVTRPAVAQRIQAAFQGAPVGVFRDATQTGGEDRVLPIISRAPQDERGNATNLENLDIFSPAAGRHIPIRQVLTGFETAFEEPAIHRRDRVRTVTLHADQVAGETSTLWQQVAPQVEAMFKAKQASGEIGRDYTLAWGGEYEDSNNAIAALSSSLPMFVGLMVLIVIALFNNLRQPLIVWLTVPSAIIGVTAGLLLFDEPFGFMALLGTLALSGMLIKNAIVLIDQINLNLSNGMTPYDAIIDSGVSRMRPVMMAAATTVLGMLPLLTSVFFKGMAIAIMFGLTFATVLTLLFVPTLYAALYRVRKTAEVTP